MSYQVKFKDVGRNKESWEIVTRTLDENTLALAVLRKRALMSHGVDVILSEDRQSGVVVVGGWRTVGTLEIVDLDQQAVSA